jgi:hypothetical protein
MKFEELNEIQKCRVFSAMEHADNKCLTVKGNLNGQADIVLETENEEKAQVFSLRKYDDEYCVIVTNEDKKLVLDVCGGRNVAGARIIQYPYHGGANQLFRLKEKETGYYVLQSKLGYVVDVEGKNVADGTRIILWN